MNQSSSSDRPATSPAKLIPAREFPTRVEVKSESLLENYPPEETLKFHTLDDSTAESTWVASIWRSAFLNLSDDAAVRLAAGEVLLVDSLNGLGGPGMLELFWWLEGKAGSPILKFTSQAPFPDQMGFREWMRARFPVPGPHRNNELLIIFYLFWIGEIYPEVTHPSHGHLLQRAVVDNDEQFVRTILSYIGNIYRESVPVAHITETPLGIAMENADDLPDELGFAGGCHRSFRQDDFCMAEDSATWVARARRIADLLRSAGAIDYSPLLKACRDGNGEEVARMLDAGFPPNFAVYGHATALTEAVRYGQLEICRLLLQRGASPNLPIPYVAEMTWGGSTFPLQLALGNARISALLLDAGADPAMPCNDSDCTPVVFSGSLRSGDAAEAVFSRCGFGEIRSAYGATGLHHLETADLYLCRQWITPDLVNHPDNSGKLPLLEAIKGGDIERVELLLDLGADPNQPGIVWRWGFGGESIFMISWDSVVEFPLLLTPAQAALLGGNPLVLDLLIARNARCTSSVTRINRFFKPDSIELSSVRRQLDEDGVPVPETSKEPGVRLQPENTFRHLWSADEGDSLRIIRRALKGDVSPFAYPGLFEELDLAVVAKSAGVGELIYQLFEKERCLTVGEILCIAQGQIVEAWDGCADFRKELDGPNPEVSLTSLAWPIRNCERTLNLARLRMLGLTPPDRILFAGLVEIVAVEFGAGMADALLNKLETSIYGFEMLIALVRETPVPDTASLQLRRLASVAENFIRMLKANWKSLLSEADARSGAS